MKANYSLRMLLVGSFMAFTVLNTLSVNAQNFVLDSLYVYGGVSYVPVETSEFLDVHISDWERFGLGPVEGRVAVPLQGNAPGSSIGVALGAYYSVTEKWAGSVDINYSFSSINLAQVLAGVHYALINSGRLRLAFSPRVGYSWANGDFGSIEVLPGKTPPVILDEGTFNVGDQLRVELTGIVFQLGVSPSFKVNEKVRVIANLNYGFNFGGDALLKAGDINIPFSSNAVVRSDGSSAQAGVSPQIDNQGFGASLTVAFRVN